MIVVNIFGADVTVCAECANFIIDELGAHSIEAELFFSSKRTKNSRNKFPTC